MVSPKEIESKAEINTGIITWDDAKQTADALDWGATLSDLRTKTDDLELKWSDDEKDSEASDEGIKMKCDSKEEIEEEGDEPVNQHIDIMAQQLKFVACLKILMEELSTLATGFEVDGEY